MGNLKERHNRGGMRDQGERFFYDNRNRLSRTDRRSNGGAWQIIQRQLFDASGNIVCKQDISALGCAQGSGEQNYFYNSSRPHAVTTAGSRTFDYDANGNVIRDRNNGITDRQFHYTTSDQVRRIQRGNLVVEFHYGADGQRTLQRELEGSVVKRRTHYVGNVEVIWEGANPASNAGEYRRRIAGVVLATFFQASGIDRVRSLHTDHIGSITAIGNENGWVDSWLAFDAWGQRRNANNWTQNWQQWATGLTPVWAQTALAITARGFTGHEHIDEMGIIHMNGRIYDAQLGRFLQADPFVEDSTTLNRYTYVHNNPLAYTDPSGFFSFGGLFKKIGRALSTLGGIISLFPCEGCQGAGAVLNAIGVRLQRLGRALSRFESTATGTLPGAFGAQQFWSLEVDPFSSRSDATLGQQIAQYLAFRFAVFDFRVRLAVRCGESQAAS